MDSIEKPQATQWKSKKDENKTRFSEKGSKLRTISNSDEITAPLDIYDPLIKPKNLVVIDDPDSAEAEGTSKATIQKRALTTRTSLNLEDIKSLKTISNIFNNNLRQTSHQQKHTYERFSSVGAQTPCSRRQQSFIDSIETIGPHSLNHSFHHSLMNPQHISEIDGNNGVGIEKALGQIAGKSELESNGSVFHIDDLEQAETNNIQKVSHLESIELSDSDASNKKSTIVHINDVDGLDDHSAIITAVDDDAQEQGTPDPSKTTKKNEWDFARRYRKHTNNPQVSRTPQAPKAVTQTNTNMARTSPQGPIKPVNRLGNPQTAATPSHNRGFDPHSGGSYKRRKTEASSFTRNGMISKDINLDQEPKQDQRHVRQNSTESQYNNSSYLEFGPERNFPDYRVKEYQAVHDLVQLGKKKSTHSHKVNRKVGSQDSINGNSGFRAEQTANAKRIVNSSHLRNSEDPIEDELQAPESTPKITPRVETPFNGNAHLPPGRQFPHSRAKGPSRPLNFLHSQPSRQISLNLMQNRRALGDLPVEDGSEDELAKENWPEVSIRREADESYDKKKLYDDGGDESYEYEQSLSTEGDIARTDFGKCGNGNQKEPRQEMSEKYRVISLFSESEYWVDPKSSLGDFFMLQDIHTRDLTLVDDSGEFVKSFVITSESIKKLKRSQGSSKIVLWKSSDRINVRGPRIYIEFYNELIAKTAGDALEQPGMKTIWEISTQMDSIFHHVREELTKFLRQRAAQKLKQDLAQPDDIKLMVANEHKRIGQGDREGGMDVDGQRRTRKFGSRNEDIALNPPKRPKLIHAMQTEFNAGGHKVRSNKSEISPANFYDAPSKATGSRASLRSADKPESYKTAPKERTPSPEPERWSQVNTGWVEDWHKSVVYPKTGKKTATVDKQDIYRLDEGEFLNDNLIMFYLLWLEQQHPKLTNRVYVHNTFFYASLTKTVRGKRGINYEAVERWTAKVDLLTYDYIVVPVNENAHWYVAIICNAPKLLDTETKEQLQSVENGANIELDRGRGIESRDTSKPITPSESPQPTPKISVNDTHNTGVDNSFEHLSLFNTTENETPLDVEPAESVPPNNHGLPSVSPEVETGNAASSKSATHVINLAQSSSPSAKADSAAKGKRRLATRNYDPKQPRIITLDSLGLKHSPTCVNLRDYMVAEIKAKKGTLITPPKNLGMAAKTQSIDEGTGRYLGKGLPLQGNFCDCGVYLLSYMEEFFERPDGFIEDIMENKHEVDGDRNDAPAFRAKIRELLFELQAEQARGSEAAKKTKLAKRRKDAPLMPIDKTEPPNLQTASLSALRSFRQQPVSDISTRNVGRNHDTLTDAARMAQNPAQNLKSEEVISIGDSQDIFQEQCVEESTLSRVKNVDNRTIKERSRARGRDKDPRQTTNSAVKYGPSEPPVRVEIPDSFEDQESTQEIANRQPLAQQPKTVVELDRDGDNESQVGESLPGSDSQGATNGIGKVVGKILYDFFLPGKKDDVGQTASKGRVSRPKPVPESQGQDGIQALENPSHSVDTHSGMNLPRRLNHSTKSRQCFQALRSPSPDLDNSRVSQSKKMSFSSNHVDLVSSAKSEKRNDNRVDLTEDGHDEMLLDQTNFPDVQEIPSSPLSAGSRERDQSSRQLTHSGRKDGEKDPGRFRHPAAEKFVGQRQLSGRDPAEETMIAQSKGEILQRKQ
ncbi:hypothetical protein SBOR_6512 [Sclerotinia borealis F-4128]|uniref:Ubiquitin-like protease family profile domain-containing protein n=1 Tax=Sclerotinia borealis (strain F-4128) TaxID=1432307 RepID=W9C8K1_SCLBF|nr:hypothetical protein SBOR_6512 [Sclerotinia borealis F-4128]